MSINGSVCPSGTAPSMSGVSGALLTSLIGSLLSGACDIGNPDDYPLDTNTQMSEFDFVIVGAGAAGSVLATRLTESTCANFTVALLEAGGNPPPDSDVPGLSHTLQMTDADWQYKTEPQTNAFQGLEGNRCLWPRGKALGGSTVLNAMIYVRGHKNDYDNWVAKGNPDWDYASVLPYFKRSEDIKVAGLQNSMYHASGGPLPVSNFEEWPPIFQAMLQSAVQTGSRLTDVNGAQQAGFNKAQVTASHSVRFNAAKAFLKGAKARENIHVFKHAQATKVIFEGARAVGVEFVKNGQVRTLRARQEVILSAGAINSPQLLMLSGVGPVDHLNDLNISVVHNLPGVGRNLQDHSRFMGATFSVPKENNSVDPVFQYFQSRSGRLSTTGALSLTGFISTIFKSRNYPDVQMHFEGPFSDARNVDVGSKIYGLTQESKETLFRPLLKENRDVYIMEPILLRPKSRGWIQLQSSNPTVAPKIFANFFEHEEDVETLARGAMWSLAMSQAKPLIAQGARLNTAKLPGCSQFPFLSFTYWKCAVRHTAATTYHPAGTCKMGPAEDALAVVDAELRVHGVKGLRVVDASIMPDIVSGNTMAPVYMIAEKAVDLILNSNTKN
ncbi:Hypothetical predicted protein [Cloeon dipterum]|uniref:Glucose-methanol-choline oxidoreductase N-terminal domain-containing protein n=3 Tax=Cloeon dipterum TaxID=197152 RepID=A0A8S1CP87_9INSE|nr:Hypothetical predicted protein [Cloeon dipterum]